MFDVQKFAYKVFVLGGTLPFQFQLNTTDSLIDWLAWKLEATLEFFATIK